MTYLSLFLPALVPWAVGGFLNHVVAIKTGDWDKRNRLWDVTNLLNEVGGFLDNFLVTRLGPLGCVHLVNGNNKLSDTKSESEKSVLTSLAIFRDTSLELTSTSSNDEDGTVSLGSSGNHVFNEVAVTRGVCIPV
jgi:hypothetical protein